MRSFPTASERRRVGIFVIFGRRDRGACGPENQLNHSPGTARRKVIHHRLRAPTPGWAAPLVNNFGGTIRVGIVRFSPQFWCKNAIFYRLFKHYPSVSVHYPKLSFWCPFWCPQKACSWEKAAKLTVLFRCNFLSLGQILSPRSIAIGLQMHLVPCAEGLNIRSMPTTVGHRNILRFQRCRHDYFFRRTERHGTKAPMRQRITKREAEGSGIGKVIPSKAKPKG
jgi:hypothetical protein